MKLLRKGKVKEVWEVSDTELEFVFTDQISVFDKVIPSLVPRKGETLCKTSAHWFRVCEEMGMPTHFKEVTGPNRMRVARVDVIPNYTLINTSTRNYLIPLEVITRYCVAGSLHDRLKSGKIKPQDVGFPKGHKPEYGEPLPEPFFEQTTKLEKVDRPVGMEEAMRIAGLTRRDYEGIREAALHIDKRLGEDVKKRGLIHVDGKKEFAFDARRKLMVVDTFGTADEDRFWDSAEYEKGRCVELSKEFVRQYYRNTGYYDKLVQARERKKVEPAIPALPQGVLTQVSSLYLNLYTRLTGEMLV